MIAIPSSHFYLTILLYILGGGQSMTQWYGPLAIDAAEVDSKPLGREQVEIFRENSR